MVAVELALALRRAGVTWTPAPGDRFVVTDRDMDDEVFVISEMTIQVHELPTGPVLGFNGTVEWALDDVDATAALWLPREDQLRDLLGEAFTALRRTDGGYTVTVGTEEVGGPDPATAYALAVLLLRLPPTPTPSTS